MINKAIFTIRMLNKFHDVKKIYMQNILEELNSSPQPAIRFYRSELKRLAHYEEKFLELMESYPGELPQNTIDNLDYMFDALVFRNDI